MLVFKEEVSASSVDMTLWLLGNASITMKMMDRKARLVMESRIIPVYMVMARI